LALKICLAIYYDFVIMAAFYEKNLLLFWSWANVDPAGWLRSSGIFRRKSYRFGASNNSATGRCHSPGSAQRVRGSAQRVRSAAPVFAQPFFQCGQCLRVAAMGVFLRRAF